MRKTVAPVVLAIAAALGMASAHGAATFRGEDFNNSATTPLSATPLSDAAAAAFLATLSGVGTETFESFAAGTTGPLVLSFPGSGGALAGTLSGGSGQVSAVATGTTNGAGRYSVPSPGSTNFWEVAAGFGGDFTVSFSQDVGAFGFYGIDIGDLGGDLTVQLLDASGAVVGGQAVGNSTGNDGSVLFFGYAAASSTEVFRSIRLLTNGGAGDFFAFDNFTVGTYCQIAGSNCTPPDDGGGNAPEPATLALVAAALVGLRLAQHRRG
jgi:hypothetical protein